MKRISLYSRRILLPDGIAEATIHLAFGSIQEVVLGRNVINDFVFYDHGDDVIMPGLIDSHVHINEPGRTEWEGFSTATQAAAAGGITTLIDMPLNSSPVTTSKDAFNIKLDAAHEKCHVNCGFWGGVIPSNKDEFEELLKSGVYGVKAFLTHSGIDQFPSVTKSDLIQIAPLLKKYNLPLLVHCELDARHEGEIFLLNNPTSYQAYLSSRPRSWENNAIALMIDLCEQFNIKIHIVHVSSSDAIELIRAAKKKGLPLTAETCPHYLFFNAEEIQDGYTTLKCAPPIRERSNNNKLWAAIKEGVIDFVVTDHSPAPPELKEIDSGDFKKAWGGIASLQYSISAFWTKAQKRSLGIADLAKLMSTNVAKFLDLDHKKGKIAVGYDADILVWDPESFYTVRAEDILFRHKITPYAGEQLQGVVKQTICGGAIVFGQDVVTEPAGKLLLKD